MTIPDSFDSGRLLEYLVAEVLEATVDDIEAVARRLGRNYYPAVVAALYAEAALTQAAAQVVVPAAWSDAEFPLVQLDEEEWAQLFNLAGYTVEGAPADRPSASLTLWRGASNEHRNGWSWTDDRELAQWFADRPHHRGNGAVWVAKVEPTRLLARISEQRPGESEYVVDARGLVVAADSSRTG